LKTSLSTTAAITFAPETLLSTEWLIPVIQASASCGKPDYVEESFVELVDLNKQLIERPRTTYGLTARGESMLDAGIEPGDLLIVDRAAEPQPNSIVIVEVDGEYTVKKLSRVGRQLWLVPGNKSHKPMEIRGEQECTVWGVVKWIIKRA
jgi:DNA polymerase V